MISNKGVTLAWLMENTGVGFGTSGARGLITALSDEVCYAYTVGYLKYLRTVNEFQNGTPVAMAGDLRSSTPRILRACMAAIADEGGKPDFCGFIPTPALAFYAFNHRIPSLMVTGSHIPDDRNGIKFNRSAGEFLKSDEAAMRSQSITLPEGIFDEQGKLRASVALGNNAAAIDLYQRRYIDFFGENALSGLRLGIYRHSAVGRDILENISQGLGAEILPLGESKTFIPVDTEAVRLEDIDLGRFWADKYHLDAIISTDGDSDRPFMADESGAWIRGDVLGIVAANYLGADCVVTPVSSNTALEKCGWFKKVIRTRIGSPYVIEGLLEGLSEERSCVCGFEANGGFLLASPIHKNRRVLAPLPTRDALLPMLCVLASAREQGIPVSSVMRTLPPRFTFSDRLQNIPAELSRKHLANFSTGSKEDQLAYVNQLFGPVSGNPLELDFTDGVRMIFSNQEVIHIRPSGNAPELRCYTEADSMARSVEISQSVMNLLRSW